MSLLPGQVIRSDFINQILNALRSATSVISGLDVVPTSPPSMSIVVKAGTAIIGGSIVSLASDTTVSVPAPDPSYPRLDLVTLKPNGTIGYYTGTPEPAVCVDTSKPHTCVKPKPPATPAGELALAEVWVPPGATAIDTIIDRRVVMPAVTRGATRVVAASNSVDKSRAHYVCDGVDDQVEINKAIQDVAAAGGGMVVLLEGTYIITGSINLASNVALVGQGPGTVLRIPNGFNRDINVIYGSGISNVLVANLMIDGNRASQAAGTMRGIYLSSVSFAVVRNCWVGYMRSAGIYITSSSYCIVEGCHVMYNGSDGVCLYNYCYYCVVSNCVITGNSYGITIFFCSYIAVEGCVLYLNPSGGISITWSSFVTVCGCAIYNSYSGTGISVSLASGVAIVGNVVCYSGYHGISLSRANDCVVVGNYIGYNSRASNQAYDGIHVASDSNYNLIASNVVRGIATTSQRYGVNIASSDCDGNAVVGNDLYASGRTGPLNDAGTGTVFHLSEFVVPVVIEVPRTVAADSTGVMWASPEVLIPPGAMWTAAIEATWTSTAADVVVAIELYDVNAAAVVASVSGNSGANAKSSYVKLTAGNRYVVRINITTASATAGATATVTKVLLYVRPNSNRVG
jgi:parallel beta-helix repeat protein